MKTSEYSSKTASFTVGDDTYEICLLSVEAAFKLQVTLGNQLKGLYGQGSVGAVSPDVMWSVTEKLLKHAEVNGAPLNMADHFVARLDTLDVVFFEAIKANVPGFFQKLGGLKGLFLDALAKQLGSAKSPSASATSGQATETN